MTSRDSGPSPSSKLVVDDGHRLARGTRIRIVAEGTDAVRLRVVEDANGPYEVLAMTPIAGMHEPLVRLDYRAVLD